jgi:hypothetical protein
MTTDAGELSRAFWRRVAEETPRGDPPTPSPHRRAALIGRLSLRADAEWLAELLIDLEEDEPARLNLVAALRRLGGSTVGV